MIIRFAQVSDLPHILEIYAPYVHDTAITFENILPTEAEFRERFEKISSRFPWLVCEEEGQILGYAYAATHRDRIAYQWCVESSVYLSERAQGRGIGKHLYKALLAMLKLQGIVNIYALITVPNARSIGLHQKMGFNEFALFKNIGYKLLAWHDVQWMLLTLNEQLNVQVEPVWFPLLMGDIRIEEILQEETLALTK